MCCACLQTDCPDVHRSSLQVLVSRLVYAGRPQHLEKYGLPLVKVRLSGWNPRADCTHWTVGLYAALSSELRLEHFFVYIRSARNVSVPCSLRF